MNRNHMYGWHQFIQAFGVYAAIPKPDAKIKGQGYIDTWEFLLRTMGKYQRQGDTPMLDATIVIFNDFIDENVESHVFSDDADMRKDWGLAPP